MSLRMLAVLEGICLVISLAACRGAAPAGEAAAGAAAAVEPAAAGFGLTVVSSGTDGGAGVVTTSGSQLGCGSVCYDRYPAGDVVTLTATPASSSSVFLGWSGPCAGASQTCEVLMSQERAVTATFGLAGTAFPVTISKTGSGQGEVRSVPARIQCGSTCGAQFAEGTLVTLFASATAPSVFTGWAGACAGRATCALTVAEAAAVTAEFVGGSDLSLLVTPPDGGRVFSDVGGISCPGTCSTVLPEGTPITLTAWSFDIATFAGWGGACSGTSPTCTVLAAPGLQVSADFERLVPLHQLTVTMAGSGGGTVVSSQVGIRCGEACAAPFPEGTLVDLTATAMPGTGSAFVGWSGACTGSAPTCRVTMTEPRAVLATFAASAARYPVAVTTSGSGEGTVRASVQGVECAAACSLGFVPGTVVTLSAAAAVGSLFEGWSGACAGAEASCTVTVPAQSLSVDAAFAAIGPAHTLRVIGDGGSRGRVVSSPARISCGDSCTADFAAGSAVTLTATGTLGAKFLGWGGPCEGTGSTCVVSMTGDRTVTASFEAPVQPLVELVVTRAGDGQGIVEGTGISCGGDCAEAFPPDSLVTLMALPADNGSGLAGWSGACSGTSNTCVVSMTGDRAVTATFTMRHRLTVSKAPGSGPGTVTSTPAGIDCGAECSATFPSGTLVTLVATPGSAGGCTSVFGGWSGACTGTGPCVVSMTTASEVTAIFPVACAVAELRVAKGGTGAGTVTAAGGIACGSRCSATYVPGTVVTLTAAADPGSTFVGWTGACAGAAPVCTLTVERQHLVTATFDAAPAGGCTVIYTQTGQWPGGFGGLLTIRNTGPTAWTSWTLRFSFPTANQAITQLWNGTMTQDGPAVRVDSLGYNGTIPAGGSYTGVGFNGAWSGSNPAPTGFSVNGIRCDASSADGRR